MGRTVTYVVELLVGLACLGLAVPLWRRPGVLRVAGLVFAAAGLAAMVHAVAKLAGQ
jgi:hypothetical protein